MLTQIQIGECSYRYQSLIELSDIFVRCQHSVKNVDHRLGAGIDAFFSLFLLTNLLLINNVNQI